MEGLFDVVEEGTSYAFADDVDADLFGVGELGVEAECGTHREGFAVNLLDNVAAFESDLGVQRLFANPNEAQTTGLAVLIVRHDSCAHGVLHGVGKPTIDGGAADAEFVAVADLDFTRAFGFFLAEAHTDGAVVEGQTFLFGVEGHTFEFVATKQDNLTRADHTELGPPSGVVGHDDVASAIELDFPDHSIAGWTRFIFFGLGRDASADPNKDGGHAYAGIIRIAGSFEARTLELRFGDLLPLFDRRATKLILDLFLFLLLVCFALFRRFGWRDYHAVVGVHQVDTTQHTFGFGGGGVVLPFSPAGLLGVVKLGDGQTHKLVHAQGCKVAGHRQKAEHPCPKESSKNELCHGESRC